MTISCCDEAITGSPQRLSTVGCMYDKQTDSFGSQRTLSVPVAFLFTWMLSVNSCNRITTNNTFVELIVFSLVASVTGRHWLLHTGAQNRSLRASSVSGPASLRCLLVIVSTRADGIPAANTKQRRNNADNVNKPLQYVFKLASKGNVACICLMWKLIWVILTVSVTRDALFRMKSSSCCW